MNSSIVSALIYAMVPSAVAVVGTAAATFWHPSEAFRSGLLHFAAGAAFAVVAVELLPRVMHGHAALPWVISGFGLGVLIMLGVHWLEHSLTARAGQQRWPLGLIAGGAVDQVIDGVLLGIGIAQGAGLGVLLSLSMAVEDLTFGLAIATSFGAACGMRWQKIGTAAALGTLLVIATVVDASALGRLAAATIEFLLSLASSALMYVVTEQLLVEAHEQMRSALLAATFFVGFLLIMVLGMFTGT